MWRQTKYFQEATEWYASPIQASKWKRNIWNPRSWGPTIRSSAVVFQDDSEGKLPDRRSGTEGSKSNVFQGTIKKIYATDTLPGFENYNIEGNCIYLEDGWVWINEYIYSEANERMRPLLTQRKPKYSTKNYITHTKK